MKSYATSAGCKIVASGKGVIKKE